MSFKRGKRCEPRSRDWMTGEGFTNGLTNCDISYLDSVVMNALSGGFTAGLSAARDAVAALPANQRRSNEDGMGGYVQHADGMGTAVSHPEKFTEYLTRAAALAVIDALKGEA